MVQKEEWTKSRDKRMCGIPRSPEDKPVIMESSQTNLQRERSEPMFSAYTIDAHQESGKVKRNAEDQTGHKCKSTAR